MRRVFQTAEIESLCQELKSILEACKGHVEAMKSCATQAENALNEVPWPERDSLAVSAVGTLRRALKTDKMEETLKKIENCRVRACELIPAADSDYASQTKELAAVTAQLQGLLEGMRDFLMGTPLTTDYSAFESALKEMQSKWNKVTEDAQAAVEKLLANIKGAEAICQVFSKDPVNLSTGNFIYDRTDLEIGGREPFGFRRFYNAINDRKGALGRDWNHNYEVRVTFSGGEAVLLREDGKEERFFEQEGKYLSLFASEGTFCRTEEGYQYRTRGQRCYCFDQTGRCLRIGEL